MSPLLVAYGGELLTTEELAGIIGDHLTAAGHAVHTVPVDHAAPAWHYAAVVIGSELYGQHWYWQALTYLRQNIPDLTARPTFFFQHVSHAGAGTGTVKLSRLVQLLAYEIGSALPQSFGVDQTPAQRRTSAAAWGHHRRGRPVRPRRWPRVGAVDSRRYPRRVPHAPAATARGRRVGDVGDVGDVVDASDLSRPTGPGEGGHHTRTPTRNTP